MSKYMIVLNEKYIRDAQIFYPEGLTEEEFENLEEAEIYLSSDFERAWIDRELTGFVLLIDVPEDKLEEELRNIARKYHFQTATLEAIPVKDEKQKGWERVFGKYGYAEKLIGEYGEEGFIQQFYEFLQGKMHPDRISRENAPDLTKEQAWHVIYCMQEYLGIFDVRFERCKLCERIYDSGKARSVINRDIEPAETIEESGNVKLKILQKNIGIIAKGTELIRRRSSEKERIRKIAVIKGRDYG